MALTLITSPSYIQATDRLTGENHPTYADTLNAAAKDIWSVNVLGSPNTFETAWVDADTIQVLPGFAIFPNGHAVTLDAALALTFSDLVEGVEAASTLYYLYLEETTGGVLTWFFSSSATVPGGHVANNTIRITPTVWNNGSSNIQPFYILNGWYYYDIDIALAGSDATEVQDGAVTTATTDVTCSGFIPTGARLALVVCTLVTATSHFVSFKGSSAWVKIALFVANGWLEYRAPLNSSGVFSIKNGVSSVTRISVRGFAL